MFYEIEKTEPRRLESNPDEKLRMRRTDIFIIYISLSLFWVLGCDTLNTVKVDNPVVGPPPPRLTMDNEVPTGTEYVQNPLEQSEMEPSSSGVLPVSFSKNKSRALTDVSPNQIVATVNGSPIFASDILERYGKQLMMAQQKMPPKQFQKARLQLIQRDLKPYIERKLLVLKLKSTLTKTQLEMIDEQLDKVFEKEIDRLQKELKAGSKLELAEKLKQQGTSLEQLREAFASQQLAMEYLRTKSKVKQKIGRPDLLRYYQDHIEEYSHTAKSRWQQIAVSFAKHDGKQNALKHLNQAIKELRANKEFSSVAKKYSDGIEAARGGKWDWVQKGSLADEKLEKIIFESPVGTISQVIVSEDSYTIVKVLERIEAGQKPFKDLQDEIKKNIKEQAYVNAKVKLLKELQEASTIKTIFDK